MRQRTARIWFLLISIIALYTNYYLGFLLVGFFAALVATKKWRGARAYLWMMIAAAIAFLPLILTVRSQFQSNARAIQEERTLIEGLRQLGSHFLTFILPAEIAPDKETSLVAVVRVWLVRAAVVMTGFFAVWRRERISLLTVGFGVNTAAGLACLLTAYFMVGNVFVELRHASFLFVPLLLFTASLIDDIFGQKEERSPGFGRIAAPILGVVVLASFSYSLLTLYPNMAKRGDWERVGEYIQQDEAPNQPIIVFRTFDAMALPYHYHGINSIFPDERFFDFDLGAAPGSDAGMESETAFTISKIPPESAEIWLVVNDRCSAPGTCVPLENFVQANYNVIQERDFYRQRVYLLRKKTP